MGLFGESAESGFPGRNERTRGGVRSGEGMRDRRCITDGLSEM